MNRESVFFEAFLSKKASGDLACRISKSISSADSCSFTFTGKEKDAESGYHYFGARYYDSELLTGWLSVDPMADKYPSLSPYNYCAWYPIKHIDPNGEEDIDNPIFGVDGRLLGTDENGWKGKAIVMAENKFRKGMKHGDAIKNGIMLDRYGKGIKISESDWEEVEKNGGERMSPSVENHSSQTIYYKPETNIGNADKRHLPIACCGRHVFTWGARQISYKYGVVNIFIGTA